MLVKFFGFDQQSLCFSPQYEHFKGSNGFLFSLFLIWESRRNLNRTFADTVMKKIFFVFSRAILCDCSHKGDKHKDKINNMILLWGGPLQKNLYDILQKDKILFCSYLYSFHLSTLEESTIHWSILEKTRLSFFQNFRVLTCKL